MSSLTNFIVPDALKSRFDAICHASGRTRTSVLIEMMEGYVIEQGSALATKTQQLRELDRIIEENRLLNCSVDDRDDRPDRSSYGFQGRAKCVLEPLSPFMDDGLDGWS